MHVVVVCHDVSHGGAARSVLDMVGALQDRGVGVTAVLPFDAWLERALRSRGVGVVLGPLPWMLADPHHLSDLKMQLRAASGARDALDYWRSLCERWRPPTDAVVLHVGFVHIWGAVLAATWRLPLISHPTEFGWLGLGLEPLGGTRDDYLCLLEQASDGVLALSNYMREELVPNHPRVEVMALHVPTLAPGMARSHETRGKKSLCVGVVGYLHPGKGQHVVTRAAVLLSQTRPDLRFSFRGAADPRYLAALVEEVATVPGLSERVSFTGSVEDPVDLWKGLDVLVAPAPLEGFGLAGAEAMARGLPLVHSRSKTSEEVYGREEVSGAIGYAAGDASSLAAALERVVSSPDLQAEMSRKHIAWAAARFSRAASTDVLAALVDELAGGPGRPDAVRAVDRWFDLLVQPESSLVGEARAEPSSTGVPRLKELNALRVHAQELDRHLEQERVLRARQEEELARAAVGIPPLAEAEVEALRVHAKELERHVEQERALRSRQEEELARASAQLRHLQSSTSWNVTRPLRWLASQRPSRRSESAADRDESSDLRASAFQRLFDDNGWAGEESVSGPGSALRLTEVLRRELPRVIRQLGVRSMVDAPCGDLHWMRHVELDLDRYTGIDIVPQVVAANAANPPWPFARFVLGDLVTQDVPRADLVFCRDCLVHLPYADVLTVLRRFQASGAQYLMTTTFTDRDNRDIETGDWRPINLQAPPFSLPDPLLLLVEDCTEEGGRYSDKSMAVWELPELSLPRR